MTAPTHSALKGLEVRAPVSPSFAEILTPEALRFVETLARDFGPTREVLPGFFAAIEPPKFVTWDH